MIFISGVMSLIIQKNRLCSNKIRVIYFCKNCVSLFPKNIHFLNFYLKELLSPSTYPISRRKKHISITSCYTCHICKNLMVFRSTFACTDTGKKYYIRIKLTAKANKLGLSLLLINVTVFIT